MALPRTFGSSPADLSLPSPPRRLWKCGLSTLLVLVILLCLGSIRAADSHLLWQIGNPDHDDAEFALAPGGYAQFQNDAFFIVGQSDARHDWPYVQPGPSDAWAGARQHVFTVMFGARLSGAAGNCQLVFDLLDTQQPGPPQLRIEVNGHAFVQQMPAGDGDGSLLGEPARGKPYHFTVEFPVALLANGNNAITITTVAGSWMLYDALALNTPSGVTAAPVSPGILLQSFSAEPVLVERAGKAVQPFKVSLLATGPDRDVSVRFGKTELGRVPVHQGFQTIELAAPAVTKTTAADLSLVDGTETLATLPATLTPVPERTIYILMHSHNDVGYTDIQPNIAKKQAHNVARALELIRQTRDYPEGSRFKWNLEVLLPAEDFYATATPEQKAEFEQAVHDGNIGVDGMYANLLTGVCRSEELLRQLSFAKALGRRCGVNVDSMMISDVPGLTWGIVPALAQNGIKYISDGPNAGEGMDGDRIGYVRVQWEYRPFYWQSPSGMESALYWGAQGGYSFGHHYSSLLQALPLLLRRLNEQQYPYDIVQLRWTKGDNGPPDEAVMDTVRDWNASHVWPKLVIATTSEAFHAFEQRYGAQLPVYRGDLTPYWEDGAGSGAHETALNRHSADRLIQAETLWAILNPGVFPAADFTAAWKNVALWSEHTWGAYNSISEPDNESVKAQWKFKQAYALNADEQSQHLLATALAARDPAVANAVDVYNTASWTRTDLVTLPKETTGDQVTDADGRVVPSQRLSTGELVFLARDIPPFAARRFVIGAGTPPEGQGRVNGATLSTRLLTVQLDEATGAIQSLRRAGLAVELADGEINRYLYLPGANVKDVQSNGPAKISIRESGPLVVSLLVESDAPGCRQLVREVRLVDGLDRVDINDLVDKLAVRAVEGVHFGFEFNVPKPVVRVNSPGAVGEIEKDQLAGACKNWFSVERWVDISNKKYGVTWSTADAPLVEVGGLTANLPRTQSDPNVYLKTIAPSAKIYSWAMNNHWETNYRADQEGPVWFHFALHPHLGYHPTAAMKFGVESTIPLIALPAAGELKSTPLVRIEPDAVIATAFKPADDGQSLIVRLFGASGKNQSARLIWRDQPKSVSVSDASEQPLHPMGDRIEIPGWGLVTVRAELP